jgi:dTDP-4-dehydrorhamnose 3,5-epimerase
MASVGVKDTQTVLPGGIRAGSPNIAGVIIHELGNVLTRSGLLLEVFRANWPIGGVSVQQINWVQLNPGGVTDWHHHVRQSDYLVGLGGNIKLALWDDRDESPTKGATDIIRLGAARPLVVIVPPRVWHGMRNESGMPAAYLNVTDEQYSYAEPDNWRLTPGDKNIPNIL